MKRSLIWVGAILGTANTCLSLSGSWNRRDILRAATAPSIFGWFVPPLARANTATLKTPYLADEFYIAPKADPSKGRFCFPALTPPFKNRATYGYELGRNAWALEQLVTFREVAATIRANVIRLESTGGLWVHSPQYPTGELCSLLDELGEVEHVVLPCNAFEHKAPVKAFCQKYPRATVWISPGQYDPLGSCGQDLRNCKMGFHVDGILGDPSNKPPWADEFDMATLYVNLPENAGPVSEVAFCHRPTKTLVSTDAVVYIPSGAAPEIFSTYFQESEVQDPDFWPRTVLQAVFLPLSDGYPAFDAIKDRLIRAPILRGFTDARAPNQVKEWIAMISEWDFDRVICSHFASPIAASPENVKDAFSYLQEIADPKKLPPISCQDWEVLEGLNRVIADNKLGAPVVFDYTRPCSRGD